jgi:trehalose transport system permease protein
LKREQLMYWVLISIPIIFILAFMIYPATLSVSYSFSHPEGGAFPNILAYQQDFADPEFSKAISYNLLLVAVTVPLELLVGLFLALILSKQFIGRGLLRAIMILPITIPEVVFLVSMKTMFAEKGVINSMLFYLGLPYVNLWLAYSPSNFIIIVLAEIWRTTPICMLLILAGIQSIPAQVYESASIDRANVWMQFRHITLPLLKPAIVATVLLRGIDAFKIFATPWVLSPSIPTMTGYAYNIYYERFALGPVGLARAAVSADILALFIIVFSYAFVRYTSR